MSDEHALGDLAQQLQSELDGTEIETILAASKTELMAAGATPEDLRRAAHMLAKSVVENAEIPLRTRAAMVPAFEKVFGESLPLDLRARLASDIMAFRAMNAMGYSEEEIDQSLVRGRGARKGLGWRSLAWLLLLVGAYWLWLIFW